jgi:hypothetical protein
MADVQVAVGLWRETRVQASTVLTGRQVVGHYLLHKVQGLLLFAPSVDILNILRNNISFV